MEKNILKKGELGEFPFYFLGEDETEAIQEPLKMKGIYLPRFHAHYVKRVGSPDQYGIALVYRYDERYGKECGMDLPELFESACADVELLSKFPKTFESATVYVMEEAYQFGHEVIVIVPADTDLLALSDISKLLDLMIYSNGDWKRAGRAMAAKQEG